MNYKIYKDLIVPFLDLIERPILVENDLWIFSYQKTRLNNIKYNLILNIYIHLGCPCYRYCVCKLYRLYLNNKSVYFNTNEINYD